MYPPNLNRERTERKANARVASARHMNNFNQIVSNVLYDNWIRFCEHVNFVRLFSCCRDLQRLAKWQSCDMDGLWARVQPCTSMVPQSTHVVVNNDGMKMAIGPQHIGISGEHQNSAHATHTHTRPLSQRPSRKIRFHSRCSARVCGECKIPDLSIFGDRKINFRQNFTVRLIDAWLRIICSKNNQHWHTQSAQEYELRTTRIELFLFWQNFTCWCSCLRITFAMTWPDLTPNQNAEYNCWHIPTTVLCSFTFRWYSARGASQFACISLWFIFLFCSHFHTFA